MMLLVCLIISVPQQDVDHVLLFGTATLYLATTTELHLFAFFLRFTKPFLILKTSNWKIPALF
jgi:hypothetical protein